MEWALTRGFHPVADLRYPAKRAPNLRLPKESVYRVCDARSLGYNIEVLDSQGRGNGKRSARIQ
jgi:hypothetical protein